MFASKWIVAALLLFPAPILAAEKSLSSNAKKLLEHIQADGNTMEIRWNETTQTPEVLAGRLTTPSKHTPEWITYEFLNKVRILYDLKRVKDDLKLMTIEKSDTGTKVYLKRQLFGKPVCGNQIIVDVDPSGVITRIEGVMHTGLNNKRLGRPMYPAVTPEKAKRIVMEHNPQIQSILQSINTCYLPVREGIPLVYVVTFESEDGPLTFTVHSQTGRIIDEYR